MLAAEPGPTRLDLWAWGLRFNGIPVGVDGPSGPRVADLRMAGAHPVRGTGGLIFDVPREAQVDLELVDVQGRAVRTLFSGRSPGGTTSMQWRTGGIAPGVYFAVLRPGDELKFVLAGREDYEWARRVVAERALAQRCPIHFSPVWGALDPAELAAWILADRLPVRLGLQLHMLLWGAEARGV